MDADDRSSCIVGSFNRILQVFNSSTVEVFEKYQIITPEIDSALSLIWMEECDVQITSSGCAFDKILPFDRDEDRFRFFIDNLGCDLDPHYGIDRSTRRTPVIEHDHIAGIACIIQFILVCTSVRL